MTFYFTFDIALRHLQLGVICVCVQITRHAWNNANLVEILDSPVSVIKHQLVNSFLVTIGTAAGIPLVRHYTRVVSGPSWPIANDTLTRVDVRVTWKLVKYYCCLVNLMQSDGISIVISDEHGCRVGTYNESTIVKSICPACKHSGAH